MKRFYTLTPVNCPECNSDQISLTCTNVQDNIRTRYKRCKDCGHKFKTEQLITEEKVVAKKRSGYLPGNQEHAKLSEQDVMFIRQTLANGLYTPKDLAFQYDVSYSAVSQIKTGKTWKHVEAAS